MHRYDNQNIFLDNVFHNKNNNDPLYLDSRSKAKEEEEADLNKLLANSQQSQQTFWVLLKCKHRTGWYNMEFWDIGIYRVDWGIQNFSGWGTVVKIIKRG